MRQMRSPAVIFMLIMVVALILTQSSSCLMIHCVAQILGKMIKCRLCGPKRAMGFEGPAMCLRVSFTSPKILLMKVLSQGIGSLIPFQNQAKPAPKGKHVQLFKMRCKVGKGCYSTAPDAPDGL